VVPAGAGLLANEVFGAMWYGKVKTASAVVATLLLTGGLSLWAVSTSAEPPPPVAAPDRADRQPAGEDVRAVLLGLEKQGWESMKGSDQRVAPFALGDDFVAVMSDGDRLDRAGFLALLADVRVTSYSLSDETVTSLSPDAAIVTYRVKAEYRYKGEAVKEALWVSSAWAKRGGKWVSVHYHESLVKK
jgi:hypothetical protein